jgi:hypothetical protein
MASIAAKAAVSVFFDMIHLVPGRIASALSTGTFETWFRLRFCPPDVLFGPVHRFDLTI